jgi:hypothetical protein
VKPFPLPIPPILRPYILDLLWDVDALHALPLPAVEIVVAELTHHLELPFWAYEGKPFQLTPHQVAADLAHPLDVVRRPDGRLTILDGVHRLLRAELSGLHVITVRVLDYGQLHTIAVPD